MTELDTLISIAYATEGKQEDVNKVYLQLLKTALFVPIKKQVEESEDFEPLFAKIEDSYFMSAFDQPERLVKWLGDNAANVDSKMLTGKEIIAGISENVFLCLNLGCEFYKEFSPEEIKHLKKIVTRIDALQK